MLHLTVGGGGEWVADDQHGSALGGFDLVIRRGQLGAGPFLDGGGGQTHDSAWLGLAAGWIVDPVKWARLELLGEVGAHSLGLESAYAGQPTVRTWLPFVGVRAGAYRFFETFRNPMVFWARRAGFGLQVLARTDVNTAALRRATPPEVQAPAQVKVGGPALAVSISTVLEW
jgi:hypothetical protein